MREPHEVGRGGADAELGVGAPGCRVFGVVRAGRPLPPELDRVAGRPLRLLAVGEVAAVVCDDALPTELPVDAPAVAPGVVELLAHEAVVERLALEGTVVPAAPGSRAPREGALAAWLDAAGPSLVSLLARLDGRCEVGVLAWWDAGAPSSVDEPRSGPPGEDEGGDDAPVRSAAAERAVLITRLARDPMCAAYLGRRRLRARELASAAARADALARALHARLGAAAEGARRTGPARLDVLLDAAYLLPHQRLPALDEALAEAVAAARAAGAPTLSVRRSGPRVPWRFATLRPFTADARRSAATIGAGQRPTRVP